MNDEELLRYSRHILLPEIDVDGQERLLKSHVMIVGAGGLGSPIALYLAAAGIGTITICDFDEVEISNIQRQVAHHTSDIGKLKVHSAAEKMKSINPDIKVHAINAKIDSDSIKGLMTNIDLVVDATDNFSVRTVINRACVASKTPVVFGAAVRLEGQLFIYDPAQDEAPCYECLHENVDDNAMNCAENGVAGPLVGIIGTMEALEAIRLICKIGKTSAGYFQSFDARDMSWNRFKVLKRSQCKACG